MDLIEQCVQQYAEQHRKELDKVMINFLRNQGYEISDNPSIEEIDRLHEVLESEGKRLRVETFLKWSGKCTIMTAIFPFFEPVDQEISRVEIYRMLNLAEQGYQI